jgi:hypothetical protein
VVVEKLACRDLVETGARQEVLQSFFSELQDTFNPPIPAFIRKTEFFKSRRICRQLIFQRPIYT